MYNPLDIRRFIYPRHSGLIAYDAESERRRLGIDAQGRRIPYGQPGSTLPPPPEPEPVLPIDEVGQPGGDMLDLMGQSLAKQQEAEALMASGAPGSEWMTLLREALDLKVQAQEQAANPPPPPEPVPEPVPEPEVAPPPPEPEPPVVIPEPEPVLPIDEVGTTPVQTGPMSQESFMENYMREGLANMGEGEGGAQGLRERGQVAYQEYLQGFETSSPMPDFDPGMATTMAVGEEDGGMPPSPPPEVIEPVAPPPPEVVAPPPEVIEPVAPPPPEASEPPEVIDTIGVPPSEYVPPPAFVPPPPPPEVQRPESQYTQIPGQGGMATTRMQGEEEGMTGYTGEGIIGGGQVTTLAVGEEDGGMPFPPTPQPIQPGPSGPDLAGGSYNQQVQGYQDMFNNYQNMMPSQSSQIDFSSFNRPKNQGIMAARRKT